MKLVRLDVVPGEFCSNAAVTPPAARPPSAQAVEARLLVESWLATTFLRRSDAVESLVERIAARLAERDARVEAVDVQPDPAGYREVALGEPWPRCVRVTKSPEHVRGPANQAG